jgi:ATP-dependent HslUV protease subunit HslV
MGERAASTRHGATEIGLCWRGRAGRRGKPTKGRGGPERDGLGMRPYGVGVDCHCRFYQACLRLKGQSTQVCGCDTRPNRLDNGLLIDVPGIRLFSPIGWVRMCPTWVESFRNPRIEEKQNVSTITAVQKNGMVAIAADQMTTQGSCKCLGPYKSHPTKIIRLRDSFIGVAGSTAHMGVIRSLAENYARKFDLSSVSAIFESFRSIHKLLVDDYYLLTKEDDNKQPYESNQMNLLIVNSTGIYEVQGYREVIQYERFWSTGSGSDYAVGAMEAIYTNTDLSAQQVAERGVEVGCLFDDASGLPVESYAIRLRSTRSRPEEPARKASTKARRARRRK